MKNLATKVFAIIFVLMLAAGCASSITAPQQLPQGQKQVQKQHKPGNVTSGGNMSQDVERPDF